jgi:curved DNA-binding protein CbpA
MPMSREDGRARGALASGGTMQGAAEKAVDEGSVPHLVPGWEQKGGQLSPEEGFLLSRIDGCTSWEMLRHIGGLEPEKVDRCLERWLAEGLVAIRGQGEEAPGPPPERPASDAEAGCSDIDEALDIPVELQRRILEFEAGLDQPYHEILGVGRDADERDIKRAYFKLSKDFHPDRYFGREIGPFADRLDRIFKKVALAHELLTDPATRAEIEQAMPPPAPPEEPPESQTRKPVGPAPAPRKLGKREMLERMRRQFRIPEKILTERRFKAKQFCEAARVAQHKGRWNEAASCIRLSIAFDPWTEEYTEAFGEILGQVNQARAAELFEAASGAWDERSAREALRLFEEAIHYRPSHAGTHDRAAQVALEIEDLERAREYAERACELAPEAAVYHLTRGRVLRGQGLRDKAREAFERAMELDPDDSQARQELKRLRKQPGPRSGGKR